MKEKLFVQTLIGRALADDIYIGSQCIAARNQDIGIGLVNRFITAFSSTTVSSTTIGMADHFLYEVFKTSLIRLTL
jgi:hypothetical protein